MTTYHFNPETYDQLTWFTDSPDAGDPACLCSFCDQVIKLGEMPLRIFDDGRELRLHMLTCARQVIQELQPLGESAIQPRSHYVDHPAFAEGRSAFAQEKSRGSCPHRGGNARLAWLAGWDEAWENYSGAIKLRKNSDDPKNTG